MPSIWRLAVVSIGLWLCLLIYISVVVVRNEAGPLSTGRDSETSPPSEMMEQLQRAFLDIEVLKEQNAILKSFILRQKHFHTNVSDTRRIVEITTQLENYSLANVNLDPTVQFEHMRRRALNGLQELWYFVMAELKKLRRKLDPVKQLALLTNVDQILDNISNQERTVWKEMFQLGQQNGREEGRRMAIQNISQIVQRRLQFLQNPSDCSTAKKLLCNLNKGCGYGCQLHHAVYCLIVAYGTGRTLILDARGWRYSHRGWSSVFLPVSDTCTDATGNSTEHWKGESSQSNVQIVQLPIIDSLRPRPRYLPLSFPQDLAERLLQLHGYPPVWWIGQFVRYLVRPQKALSKELDDGLRSLGFKHPIVGIHVRRTDKIASEAQFHSLDEYMFWANDFFLRQELAIGTELTERLVFIASDDPNIFDEAAKRYPNYKFVGNKATAKSAQLNSRYSDASLHGIIADVHYLSLTDYLVCTFSSQVCRLAYELMQTYHADASDRFHSLDDIYYFGGQDSHEQVAKISHSPQSAQELSLSIGDVIGVAGNHWDGWSKGRNLRTGNIGLYPSYKTVEKWRIETFPTYPEAEFNPSTLPRHQRIVPSPDIAEVK